MTAAAGFPRSVHVRGLNWIGDAVLSLGALQGLKARHPDLRIEVGAPAATADIYRLSPVVECVTAPGWERGRGLFPFDAAVVLPRSFRSAFESLPIARTRIGFASEGRSFLLTRALDYRTWKEAHRHQSTYYEALFREIDPAIRFAPPRIEISESAKEAARHRLKDVLPNDGPILAVNPGAFFGRAKTWPLGHFQTLIVRLQEASPALRVLLFSGTADRPLATDLFRRLSRSRVHSFAGELTLAESAAMLSLCDFLLTNDSGMMHLGGALGLPGAALFGPTDPVSTGPVAGQDRRPLTVLRHFVSCQPCFLRECPIDHRCMEELSPGEVANALLPEIDAWTRDR